MELVKIEKLGLECISEDKKFSAVYSDSNSHKDIIIFRDDSIFRLMTFRVSGRGALNINDINFHINKYGFSFNIDEITPPIKPEYSNPREVSEIGISNGKKRWWFF